MQNFFISRYKDLANSLFLDCQKTRNLYPSEAAAKAVSNLIRGCHVGGRHADGLNRDGGIDSENKSLNFKVSPAFKREFKVFAASHGVTMTDLLKEGFALTKQKRKRA